MGELGREREVLGMTRFLARVISKMARSYSKMGGPTEKQVWRKNRLLRFGEKTGFSPSHVCPSLGRKNNLDLHLVLLIKARCVSGSHRPTYARPGLILHWESLRGRKQYGCNLDLRAHLDAAFEKYTHFHSDCVFA